MGRIGAGWNFLVLLPPARMDPVRDLGPNQPANQGREQRMDTEVKATLLHVHSEGVFS